jgi:NADH dehydrogenase
MHVVVLGAGYAGIAVTRQLESELPPDVDLTLVDENETHLVQHLIHRVVREPGLADRLTVPISDLVDRAEHRQERVTDVDPDEGVVEFTDGTLSYDVGVICLGARTAFYGIPGVEAHATPLKRLTHVEQIREGFESVPADGRAVVCGAGLSGIQIAGELAALVGERDSPPEVLLLEQKASVAPEFPSPFQTAVSEELAAQGVTVRTDATVAEARSDALVFDNGDTLGYDQLVWTGGISGGDELGGERPQVRATLRLGDRTFAAGDAVRVVDSDGQAVPATAQTAVRQADVAATNAARLVAYHRDGAAGFEPRLQRYRYDSLGWVVSVGDGTVAQVGGSVLRGRAARAVKTTVAAGYLGRLGAVESAAEYVRGHFEGEE